MLSVPSMLLDALLRREWAVLNESVLDVLLESSIMVAKNSASRSTLNRFTLSAAMETSCA